MFSWQKITEGRLLSFEPEKIRNLALTAARVLLWNRVHNGWSGHGQKKHSQQLSGLRKAPSCGGLVFFTDVAIRGG